MSQHELAQAADVSRPTIAAIEVGEPRKVKLETVVKLAQALNIDISELLGETPARDNFSTFLDSALASDLKISAQEQGWLRTIYRTWPAGKPGTEVLCLILAALRINRKSGL